VTDRGALTHGPIGRTLLTMTGGMLIGHVAMSIFNVTDTWFVSRLGTTPLAAISFSFPVIMLTNGTMFGLGMGTGSVISRAIGQGDRERVRRLTTHALLLTFGLGLVIATAGLLVYRPLFAALGASEQTLDLTLAYMRIWYLGFPLGGIPMVMNNAIRATGDARTPGIIMAAVAVANLVLDPLFIFGPGPLPALGLEGAALATVIGRLISTVWALAVIQRRLRLLVWSGWGGRDLLASWRRFAAVGTPAVMTMVVLPVTGAVLTRIIARFGDPAVAAFGTGGKIDYFALMLLMAFSSVVLPYVGQNAGARLWDRVRATVRFALRFATGYCGVMTVVVFALAPALAGAFSDDPEVVRHLTQYLRLIPLCYVGFGVSSVAYNGLMGLDASLPAMWLIVVRNLGLQIPASWLGARIAGSALGVFLGFIPATLLAAVAGLLVLRWRLREAASQPPYSSS